MNRAVKGDWVVPLFLITIGGLLTVWLYLLIAQLDRPPQEVNRVAAEGQTHSSVYTNEITLLPLSNFQIKITSFRQRLVAFFLMIMLQFLVLAVVIYSLARPRALIKIFKHRSKATRKVFDSERPAVDCTRNRWFLLAIFIFAALFRLVLLPQTPWLSGDIYRYLWDGRVFANGINPFQYPPNASELVHLRDDKIFAHINHKEVATVYPPLLQAIFWLAHQLGGTVEILKCIFILTDLLLILLLFWSLPKLGIPSWWAILYAWHPLAIIEIAGSGHVDGVGALFLFAAVVWLAMGRNPVVAVVFLSIAFLVKFLSVLFLPFLFLYANDSSKNLSKPIVFHLIGWFLIFGIIVFAAYLPFIDSGPKLIAGLKIYAAKWRFNDAIFALFYSPIYRLIPDALVYQFMIPAEWEVNEAILSSRRIDLSLFITKILAAVIFVGFLIMQWRHFRGKLLRPDDNGSTQNLEVKDKKLPTSDDLSLAWPALALKVVGAFLLLSPTIQPWYLLWMLPFLCLVRQPGWVAWSTTIFLAYWVLDGFARTGLWQEASWVKWVEYGVVGIVALIAKTWKR
jgi:hypothetical protein